MVMGTESVEKTGGGEESGGEKRGGHVSEKS